MKKKLLIVEDEERVLAGLKRRFLPYASEIDILEAVNASDAFDCLFNEDKHQRPHAVILDIMMAYGENEETKSLLNADTDRGMNETGKRILSFLRKKENAELDYFPSGPIFVAILTARSDPLLYSKIQNCLNGYGKIYPKPFSTFVLINDITFILGIESQVNSLLLPSDYEPPKLPCGDENE